MFDVWDALNIVIQWLSSQKWLIYNIFRIHIIQFWLNSCLVMDRGDH